MIHHSFEAIKPRVMKARAPNKCRCCKNRILKGELYFYILLWDLCSHFVKRKPVHFNQIIKLCRSCSGILFGLPAFTGEDLIITDKYMNRCLDLVSELDLENYQQKRISMRINHA